VVGKFWIDSGLMLYVGFTLLIAASVWNAVPERDTCPACDAGV
jgi:hypothetical protein